MAEAVRGFQQMVVAVRVEVVVLVVANRSLGLLALDASWPFVRPDDAINVINNKNDLMSFIVSINLE